MDGEEGREEDEVCQGQNIPPLIMSDATEGGIALGMSTWEGVPWKGCSLNFHPLSYLLSFAKEDKMVKKKFCRHHL